MLPSITYHLPILYSSDIDKLIRTSGFTAPLSAKFSVGSNGVFLLIGHGKTLTLATTQNVVLKTFHFKEPTFLYSRILMLPTSGLFVSESCRLCKLLAGKHSFKVRPLEIVLSKPLNTLHEAYGNIYVIDKRCQLCTFDPVEESISPVGNFGLEFREVVGTSTSVFLWTTSQQVYYLSPDHELFDLNLRLDAFLFGGF